MGGCLCEAEEVGVKDGMGEEGGKEGGGGDAARFREQQGRRLGADVTLRLTPRRSLPFHAHTQTVM